MEIFIIYVVIHLICGFIAAAASFAYQQKGIPIKGRFWYDKDRLFSKGWGFSGGPIALLVALFMTGIFQHGFMNPFKQYKDE